MANHLQNLQINENKNTARDTVVKSDLAFDVRSPIKNNKLWLLNCKKIDEATVLPRVKANINYCRLLCENLRVSLIFIPLIYWPFTALSINRARIDKKFSQWYFDQWRILVNILLQGKWQMTKSCDCSTV